MPNYRREARRAARRYGLDPYIFQRQIGAESGFNPNAVSRAGARGIAQITPATARAWGVNPNNPRQSLNAAARNMARYVRRYGSYENALRAYNAGPGAIRASRGYSETNNYVAKILRGRDPKRLGSRSGGGSGGAGATGGLGGGGAPRELPMGSTGALALLEALKPEPQVPQSSGLQLPAHAAGPALPQGYVGVQGGGGPAPKPDTNALLEAIRTMGGEVPRAPGAQTVLGPGGAGGTVLRGVKGGKVSVRPGANRAGVPLRGSVLRFAKSISAIAGVGVTIGTGSAHDQYTVNGTESDHWRGEAADIPAVRRRLIRLGQAALIAAGMPEKRARKITGGGFNIGGWQVIFNTNAPGWGDHTDHLHIGRRRR